MGTILLILGRESGEFAKGQFNQGLADVAKAELSTQHKLLFTDIEQGYVVEEEINKFKQADAVIYQYPVYWFMMPSILKKYIDDVYAYGEFFAFNEGAYGSGGLMTGKKVMLSTTWNAPDEAFGSDFFDGKGIDDVLLPMRKSHTYCGFDELPHFSCHNVIKDPQFEQDKARYIEHLRSVFMA